MGGVLNTNYVRNCEKKSVGICDCVCDIEYYRNYVEHEIAELCCEQK